MSTFRSPFFWGGSEAGLPRRLTGYARSENRNNHHTD